MLHLYLSVLGPIALALIVVYITWIILTWIQGKYWESCPIFTRVSVAIAMVQTMPYLSLLPFIRVYKVD